MLPHPSSCAPVDMQPHLWCGISYMYSKGCEYNASLAMPGRHINDTSRPEQNLSQPTGMNATLFGFGFLHAFHNPFWKRVDYAESLCESAVCLLITKAMTSKKAVMGFRAACLSQARWLQQSTVCEASCHVRLLTSTSSYWRYAAWTNTLHTQCMLEGYTACSRKCCSFEYIWKHITYTVRAPPPAQGKLDFIADRVSQRLSAINSSLPCAGGV